MTQKKDFDPWLNGKYVDLLSIVHFLVWLGIGAGMYKFKLTFYETFASAGVCIILWEVFEEIVKDPECWENRVTDAFIGIVGVIIGHLAMEYVDTKAKNPSFSTA